MRIAFTLALILGFTCARSQDTARVLAPVLIHAYGNERADRHVAASVGNVDSTALRRFTPRSLLPAFNTIPGVRMEERSPGSYRFSIRGSLLRSPFGVRNVKVYWNGLPLTDGGGNTYLNLLDFGAVGSAEVIKGPASSLYGAGTGGVVLLHSPVVARDETELSGSLGSYGFRRIALSHQIHRPDLTLRLHAAFQHADGYREQAEMKRFAFHGDLVFPAGEWGVINATFFYSNLYYQTPGALTREQFEANPRQARPAAGPNPSAVDQKAAVYNATPYVGISYERDWNATTTTTVGVFGAHASFSNPAVRNYEERAETNAGIRTETRWRFGGDRAHRLTFGGEVQYFTGPLTVFDNNFGQRGAIQTDDDLSATLGSIFVQAQWEIFDDAFLTLGGSLNTVNYGFVRTVPAPRVDQNKSFDPFFSPRIAVLKTLGEHVSIFANISRGFSPPSLAEVRPSTNAFNETLQAERGTSYEMGMRGATREKMFAWELVGYDFSLRETIIVQRLPDGADYFINAGRTSQRGLEMMVSWQPREDADGFISGLKVWTAHAYNHYRFLEYVNDNRDYAGNRLTGVPRHVNTSGLDVTFLKKIYMNTTSSVVSRIPLNDANDIYADAYVLLGFRAGYQGRLGGHRVDFFAGADNILDQRYSLGNDLNAVAGARYFNAAMPRNYCAGFKLKLLR